MKNFFFFIVVVLSQHFFSSNCLQEAKASGDIMIGGLFPIHESVEAIKVGGKSEWRCNRFSVARLAQSLMMVRAIEEVNQSGELGNITLGYHIVDSCADVTKTLEHIMWMTEDGNVNTDTQQSKPPVLAVVGGYYSEIAIAATRLLNLKSIPEISYGATSGLLSDKTRFPSFVRTVPEDDHQAFAIIKILKEHNWNWVGVVATDGEYGRYAVERLQHHAAKDQICFAFIKFLPEFLVDNNLNDSIRSTVDSITRNENVSIIISFAKPNHMMYIFENLLQNPKGRNKVWVASDNWSQSVDCLNTSRWDLKDVGTIFGITLKSGDPTKFTTFLKTIDVDPDRHQNNQFLSDYLNKTKDAPIDRLIHMIYPFAVFSIELAVKAIAQTVKDLCINKKCDISTLQPWQMRDALKDAKLSMDGTTYSFDETCDLNTGYDIVLWKYAKPHILEMNNVVGKYDIKTKKLTFFSKHKREFFSQTKAVMSRCSLCNPGEMKIAMKGGPVCCYDCQKCPKNFYSNTTDSVQCFKCEDPTHYSNEGDTNCTKKAIVFLGWRDQYHIVLLTLTSLGAVLTLVVAIIFLASWNTPVVRASGAPISIILLFSLLCTFSSVALFGARPADWKCKARQVVFGLSFTLSVSCILVKSFVILLAFQFTSNTTEILKKLYKPYFIIALCMAGQGVICTVWLVYMPPRNEWEDLETSRLLKCEERLIPAFGAMLAYIGLLAIICFIIAFMGRKLPECYNEAKFITFSMLIYFIAWIIFGPVYTNMKGKYLPAIQMVVIIISAYGILFCQFLIKCYIILFKKEANTQTAFRREVWNFSMGKDKDLDKLCPQSVGCEGISNSALSLETLSSPEPKHNLTNRKLSISSITRPLSPAPEPALLQKEASVKKKDPQGYSSLEP